MCNTSCVRSEEDAWRWTRQLTTCLFFFGSGVIVVSFRCFRCCCCFGFFLSLPLCLQFLLARLLFFLSFPAHGGLLRAPYALPLTRCSARPPSPSYSTSGCLSAPRVQSAALLLIVAFSAALQGALGASSTSRAPWPELGGQLTASLLLLLSSMSFS
eukprot:COSAG02_NODE_12224_length_1578_cov_0.936444_2_plen_157_part_00